MDDQEQAHTPSWTLADFDSAEVANGVLTVSGGTSRSGERSLGVRLVADKMYLVQPEYWEFQVQWDSADAIFMSVRPFRVSMALEGRVGTKGIVVVGRGKSVRIDLAKGS